MSDHRTKRELAEAAAQLGRCLSVLPQRLEAMHDAQQGYPPSPRFDGDAGGTAESVTFCEVHGRERCPCGQGTPFVRVSDRTGELALRFDPARADRAAVDEAARVLRVQVERLARLLERYGTRSATSRERADTLADNERSVVCESCLRSQVSRGVPRGEPATTVVVLVEGGRSVPVCQWCYRWVRSEGALPPVSAVDAHHRGVRVRRPA